MTTTTKATQNVTCPKCDGRGTIEAFRGTANGKCFCCWGAGTISVDKPSAAEALNMRAASIRYALEIAVAAKHDGNETRAMFYLERQIDAMFTIGTERAREVLAGIRKGSFWCDERGNVSAPAAGRWVAAKVVELGKAKAA